MNGPQIYENQGSLILIEVWVMITERVLQVTSSNVATTEKTILQVGKYMEE